MAAVLPERGNRRGLAAVVPEGGGRWGRWGLARKHMVGGSGTVAWGTLQVVGEKVGSQEL